MNHWLKLSIPIFLGIVAAIINAGTVKSQLATKAYVRIKVDVLPGEQLTGDLIERIELGGDLGTADESLVPWKDRAVLLNRPATAALHAGDPVYWRDFAPVSTLKAKPGQRLFSISLGGLTIVPDFIRVGTEVDFILATRLDSELDLLTPVTTEAADAVQPVPPLRPAVAPSIQNDLSKVNVELVGPFHVAAVDRRVTPGGEIGDGSNDDGRVLTIAARLDNGELTGTAIHRLLAARSGLSGEQIIGIGLNSGNQQGRKEVPGGGKN